MSTINTTSNWLCSGAFLSMLMPPGRVGVSILLGGQDSNLVSRQPSTEGSTGRWQTGQGKSPKKRKIRRKITIRKRIKSTIKMKSRTSCTRPRNAGRPALPSAPALALSPLPDLTLTLHLSLVREPLAKPPSEDCSPPRPRSHKKVMSRCGTRHLPSAIPDSEFGDPELGPLWMRHMLRNATFFGFLENLGNHDFDASS
jgi:hypothetical protein